MKNQLLQKSEGVVQNKICSRDQGINSLLYTFFEKIQRDESTVTPQKSGAA